MSKTASPAKPIPATMRAITTPQWGVARDALVAQTIATPQPGPTEVLVEVHAVGINPVDWKSRASGSFNLWGDPVILGWDVSGVVVATGGGATLYEVGDEVFGMPRFPHQAGAYADYVAAPSRQLAPKPAGLSHVEAAALPLVGLTAWQGLAEVAKVQPGQRVLVHAAGGGLGHVAVQIAKALGAHVIGTASAGKHDWLRSLGADELIDYRTTDFADAVSDLDVVFDGIGGEYTERSVDVVRDGGTIVVLPSPVSPAAAERAAARGITTGWTLVEPDRHGLLNLAELVEPGQLKPEIAATFPLDQVAAAHELGEAGHTAGKIVLEVR